MIFQLKMNTRKANLRKLRLPSSGGSDSRNGRRKAAATISEFFPAGDNVPELPNDVEMSELPEIMPSPIEKPEETTPKPKRSTRAKLSTFLPGEVRMKPALEKPISDFLTKVKSDDFETPDKNIKKAPKAKAKPRPKRQQKIKTAFLKNEEFFSAVTAQHCLVDNINPDEMQMALALSRSEADVNGVIDVDNEQKEEKEAIRDKLQRFGFRVGESEDYNLPAFAPTNKKAKWANKFTPLTLRNPKRQLERMHQKVEELLSEQFVSTDCTDEIRKYSVKSKILLPLVAEECFIRPDASERVLVVDFYVLSLFEPSRTKVGHLLKDVRCIAGRDTSPIKKSMRAAPADQILDPLLQSPATKKSRYDDLFSNDIVSLPCIDIERDFSMNQPLHPLPATISTFPNYDAAIALELNEHSCPINNESPPQQDPMNGAVIPVDSNSTFSGLELSSTLRNAAVNPNDCDSAEPISESSSTAQNGVEVPNDCDSAESRSELSFTVSKGTTSKRLNPFTESSSPPSFELTPKPSSNGSSLQSELPSSIRATSPDIFADSDVEMETDSCTEMEKLNVSGSSSGGHHISTYELFSSDEVKTSLETKSNSSDVNHNSLPTLIDLTQCGSDSNSQHSDKIVPSTTVQSYQDQCSADDFPTTASAIVTQLDDEPFTSFKTNCWSHSNGSFSLEKSTESKPSGFSFRSSASEELYKSASFNKSTSMKTDGSIDLTQDSDGEGDCNLLSDDEVNYSIWKADKSLHVKEEVDFPVQNVTVDYLLSGERHTDVEDKREFSFVDFVAQTQQLASQSEEFDFDLKTKSNASLDLLDLDLSRRSDFGILEEQSPFKTPTKTPKKTPKKTPTSASSKSGEALFTPINAATKRGQSVLTPTSASTKCRRALSASFLVSPSEGSAPLKRFLSTSTSKFNEFTKSDDGSFSDLDDIDKLIYGSPSRKAYKKPAGLDQLLTGTISAKIDFQSTKAEPKPPKEFEFNSRTYLVRTTNVLQKPNFETMDESAVLNQLYKYGIKPLKRKQAVKILEYIYNQTHPCLVDEGDIPSQIVTANCYDEDDETNGYPETATVATASKFNLKDCWGHVLVTNIDISMEIEEEQYIVQTNTSKKISTALLPFHIAWYNLVKSNKLLHEAILHYEPIDLQEVYLFFKGLGYRYDPKELKYFFDSRSIIFRYELNKSNPSNRHVRKK